uniref:Capsid protein VP1 n=1 Tax=Sipha flava TaxID=143950 RepID=A0A2S2Q167_9HEMI
MTFRYLGPPPPFRSNWSSLNSSQKRYAIEQHNIARRRRNLPPYVLGQEPIEEVGEDNTNIFRVPDNWDWKTDPDLKEHNNIKQIQPKIIDSMNISSTSGTQGVKRTNDASPSTTDAKKTKLPGTGDANDGDPDTGNPSTQNAVLDRPIPNTTGHIMVFRKNHSLISYGVASVQLTLDGFASERVGTTGLMYLPVDKPYFYLSPSEFNSIVSNIRGVRVKEVKVKVVMRNPRTAFETNASTSTLATLNQNKFIQYAQGLVNKTRGFNTVYKFESGTNTMKPTKVNTVDDSFVKKIVSAMYGTDKDDWLKPNWKEGATLPCSLMNLPMQFPVYYTMYANNAQHDGKLGWPIFNQHVTKCDASTMIGKTVLNYSYKPKVSFLSAPWTPVHNGRNTTKGTNVTDFIVANTGPMVIPDVTTVNAHTGLMQRKQVNFELLQNSQWNQIFTDNFDRYSEPLEMSQYVKRSFGESNYGTVQPSLHVGVCAVPQLTTTNVDLVPDKFFLL